MNAKQRRLVRRANQRFEHFDWYIATGGPDDGDVRALVARHVRALVDHTSGPSVRRIHRSIGHADGRRDPRVYGQRCAFSLPFVLGGTEPLTLCGRPAHGIDSNGLVVCKGHGDWVPF